MSEIVPIGNLRPEIVDAINQVRNNSDQQTPNEGQRNLGNFFGQIIHRMAQNDQMDDAKHVYRKAKRINSALSSWKRRYLLSDVGHNPNCVVCLDEFQEGEEVIDLPCNRNAEGHIFHIECMNNWAKRNMT